jgi:glycosyltransferase involved in cell wall biosynthesis
MKIAWFTPLNRRSAIGQYSARILEELIRTEQVVVYVSDTDRADACWPVNASLAFLSTIEPEKLPHILSTYDCVVYNMGNHLGYHRHIYEASLRYPGVVIIHDVVLQHFFSGYFLEFQRDWDPYIRHMAYAHGRDGEELAQLIRAGREEPVWNGGEAVKYHLAKLAVRRKYGVIVHSHFAQRTLEPIATAPVKKINFPEPNISNWLPRSPRARRTAPGEKIHLLTFGMVNRNKMVDLVIDTIGSNEFLKHHVVYTVIGAVESEQYGNTIDEIIRKHGLESSVRLLGAQPDEVLIESLLAADIVVNLRYPYLGESSWSLLEALFAGKPTIVWRHGYYDEFPDKVVRKVASKQALVSALCDLCQSSEARLAMAEEAWAYARKNFDTKQYCRQLMDFLACARLNRPILDLVDSMSDRLLEMRANAQSIELIDILEKEICRLAAIA